jgi:hypothetical protein
VQIVALDVASFDLFCDIEPVLRLLADSPDPLAAAKGRMFLALARHFRVSGPEPRVVGQLLFDDELHLRPERGEAPATVTIRPDWYDFGPREGDLPPMHYRVNIRMPGRALSKDIRTQDLERVERALREAFGWDS